MRRASVRLEDGFFFSLNAEMGFTLLMAVAKKVGAKQKQL